MILKKDIKKGSNTFQMVSHYGNQTRKPIHVSFHTSTRTHELDVYLIFRTTQSKRVTKKNVEHISSFHLQKSELLMATLFQSGILKILSYENDNSDNPSGCPPYRSFSYGKYIRKGKCRQILMILLRKKIFFI